jgi:hypothetical protein
MSLLHDRPPANVLGMGFILDHDEADAWVEHDERDGEVLFPYLNSQYLNTVTKSTTAATHVRRGRSRAYRSGALAGHLA